MCTLVYIIVVFVVDSLLISKHYVHVAIGDVYFCSVKSACV